MFVRQKRRDLPVRQDRDHHLARHPGRQQPVAVLREDCRDPDLVVDVQPHKPTEQQIMLHPLHQLPFRADREQDLEQAGPDQPLRCDRGAAEIGVERCELGIQTGQRVVHHLPDLTQRMSCRNARLEIDTAEQRPTRLVSAAHHHPHLGPTTVNNLPQKRPRIDFFSRLLASDGRHIGVAVVDIGRARLGQK